MNPNQQDPKLPNEDLDAVIIGAGFSGLYQLYRLRKAGLNVKIFEAGSGLGGTWFWNRYPGCRVDSDFFLYLFSMEETWKDWNWTERFPGHGELAAYFAHVDKVLNLSPDILYNTFVDAAHFDTTTDRWVVSTRNGITAHPRFLVLCTGFASKPLYPDYKGLDTFKGTMLHSYYWPTEGIELKGKRMGLIGTGATGVQLTQELAPEVSHLTVFQRTPNLALPMVQRTLDEKTQKRTQELYPLIFRRRPQTFAGFTYEMYPPSFSEATPEERELLYEELWDKGGFSYWLSNFKENFVDQTANDSAYAFWRKKVRERLTDPEMQRKLAPEVAPHPFGTKRPCLEQRFYDSFNLPHVDLVNLQENPITEVTPKGVKTADGAEHEFDVLILATGFDALTGGITQIDIKGTDGVSIGDKWKKGTSTYLGLASANFPNMFIVYGPQAPTALTNAPTFVEMQGDWIDDCITHTLANKFTRVETTQEAEENYTNTMNSIAGMTLYPKAKSWYMGANVPGKKVEMLNFPGGIPLYMSMCHDSSGNGYKGFTFSSIETKA